MSRFFVLGLLAIVAVTISEQFEVPGIFYKRRGQMPETGSDVRACVFPAGLPGRCVTPDQQCRDLAPEYFATICTPEDPKLLCRELNCSSARGDIPTGEEAGPALDGTWCGDKMMCLEGSCIDDPNPPETPFKIVASEDCTDLLYHAEDADVDLSVLPLTNANVLK